MDLAIVRIWCLGFFNRRKPACHFLKPRSRRVQGPLPDLSVRLQEREKPSRAHPANTPALNPFDKNVPLAQDSGSIKSTSKIKLGSFIWELGLNRVVSVRSWQVTQTRNVVFQVSREFSRQPRAVASAPFVSGSSLSTPMPGDISPTRIRPSTGRPGAKCATWPTRTRTLWRSTRESNMEFTSGSCSSRSNNDSEFIHDCDLMFDYKSHYLNKNWLHILN